MAVTEPSPTGETASGSGSSQASAEADPRSGAVEAGDNLSVILERAGVGSAETAELVEVLEPVMDPSTIRAGQRYSMELEHGRLMRFEFERSPLVSVVVERDDADELIAREVEADVSVEEVAVGGTIRTSLFQAVLDAGEHSSAAAFLADVFAYDIDFMTETHPGDTFRMIVEKQTIDGTFVGYQRVLAAEYDGKVGTHQVYWWKPAEHAEGRYVDHEGRGVARTLLKTPLKYTRVSSEFSRARMHPVLHRVKGHHGIDYAAPTGTPVWTAADGVIVFRGKQGGAGNMVVVRHDRGLKTIYMHLSRFADGQRVGSRVKAKTVIGHVGMTGLATGPHLHFAVKIRGRYVDPDEVERRRGPGVASRHRSRFQRHRQRIAGRLGAVEVQ